MEVFGSGVTCIIPPACTQSNFVSDSRNLILERLKLQKVTTYIYTEIALISI